MPGFDWQFVVVTLFALAGGWFLLRPLLNARKSGGKIGACGSCSSSACGTTKSRAGGPGLVSLGGGTRPRG